MNWPEIVMVSLISAAIGFPLGGLVAIAAARTQEDVFNRIMSPRKMTIIGLISGSILAIGMFIGLRHWS